MIIKEFIVIHSTSEKVWAILTDLSRWAEWNTVMRNAQTDNKILTEGINLKCSFYPFLFPVVMEIKIERVVPFRRIAWSTKKMALCAHHELLFERDGEGVLVLSEEEFTGLPARASGLLLPFKRMQALTRIFLADLKKASEN